MHTLQKLVLALVLALLVANVALAADRGRKVVIHRNNHKFNGNVKFLSSHKVKTFNFNLHHNATRIWTGNKLHLTSTYRGNDYHLKFAKKFDHGYVYFGKQHSHWQHKYFSPVNQVYFYWCPCANCYYWWCPEQQCYYPYGYTPAGYAKTFTW